jgi:hypothetical protein
MQEMHCATTDENERNKIWKTASVTCRSLALKEYH